MKKTYTQKEHRKINRHQYPGTRELCCICDDPTGRAGKGEDSIYVLFTEDCEIEWSGFFIAEYEQGQELGPLCEGCEGFLWQKEVIE